MPEFDVMVTDYILAVICSIFAVSLFKKNKQTLNLLWVLFFSSIAVGAVMGGTVHGICSAETRLCQILWTGSLLAIGITAASCWMIGVVLWRGEEELGLWSLCVFVLFMIYALILLFVSQNFLITIINYVPPLIFLLIIVSRKYIQTQDYNFLLITLGIILSFVAAVFQQAQIGINPYYFNYNSTYHLLEGIALFLIYIGAKK